MSNIRAPDSVIRERLIETDDDYDEYDAWFPYLNNDNDKDIELAIAESFRLFNENNNNINTDFLDININNSNEKNLDEKNLDEKNLDEKNLDEKNLDEKNLDEKNLDEKNLETKQNEILPIFKSNIKKLIHFDNQIKNLYDKIKPIIDLYERGEIYYYIMDNIAYQEMFSILRSVRIPKEEWSILDTIFIKEIN